MTRFVIDTDICIYLLNQRPGYKQILKRVGGRNYGNVLLSAITLAELRYAIAASQQRSANRAKLELFLRRQDGSFLPPRPSAANNWRPPWEG